MMNERIVLCRRDGGFTAHGSVSGRIVAQGACVDETIVEAVGRMPETGGELFVEPGTYEIAAPIKPKAGMRLAGAGGVVLRIAAGNSAGVAVLCEGVNNVTIENIEICSESSGPRDAGIVLDDCGDCRITQVRCDGIAGYGLWVRNGSFLCTINNVSLSRCAEAGVCFENLRRGRYGDYVPNTLCNSTAYGGEKGVLCDGAICTNINGCTIYQVRDVGVLISNGSNSTLVSGCRTYLCGNNAVRIDSSHENNVTGCIFGRHGGRCVAVSDSCWGVVSSNEMIFTGAYLKSGPHSPDGAAEPADGVNQTMDVIDLRDVHGFTISANAIYNWSTAPILNSGVREDARCSHNLVTANNVNYFQSAGVDLRGEGSMAADNVQFGAAPYKM